MTQTMRRAEMAMPTPSAMLLSRLDSRDFRAARSALPLEMASLHSDDLRIAKIPVLKT